MRKRTTREDLPAAYIDPGRTETPWYSSRCRKPRYDAIATSATSRATVAADSDTASRKKTGRNFWSAHGCCGWPPKRCACRQWQVPYGRAGIVRCRPTVIAEDEISQADNFDIRVELVRIVLQPEGEPGVYLVAGPAHRSVVTSVGENRTDQQNELGPIAKYLSRHGFVTAGRHGGLSQHLDKALGDVAASDDVVLVLLRIGASQQKPEGRIGAKMIHGNRIPCRKKSSRTVRRIVGARRCRANTAVPAA